MKVGIIGCGRITELRHGPEAALLPQIELAGFCDWKHERAKEFAGRFGGKAYDSAEDLLADTAVDAVVVASSNATHAQLSCKAMQAGKHVLCEKPMALTVESAEEIAKCASDTGRIFMVAQNQRFDVVNVRAKQLLQQGAIGKVLLFRAEFSHGGPEAWSVDGEKTMYFEKANNGLGALADLGIHKIDLLRWLLEEDFTGISACLTTLDKRATSGDIIPMEDNALLTLHGESGLVGTVLASWTNYGHCESTVTLYGTGGWMRVSDTNGTCEIFLEQKCAERQKLSVTEMRHSGVLQAFAEGIEMGSSPVDATEGLRGIQIVQSALESAGRNSAIVAIP